MLVLMGVGIDANADVYVDAYFHTNDKLNHNNNFHSYSSIKIIINNYNRRCICGHQDIQLVQVNR